MRALKREKLQRAMGGGHHEERDPFDFWQTPDECTIALIRFLRRYEPEAMMHAREFGILEPACGAGDMVRPLKAAGFRVRATDLVYRGFGQGGVDFLETAEPPERVIITNPPYRRPLPERFIRHAATMPRVTLTALLLPLGYWYAAERPALWRHWPPAWLCPLAWRPDFTGDGNSPFRLQWVIWSRSSHSCGHGRTVLLEQPEPGAW